MIFVTVGGMRAFERLVVAMEGIAGEIDERVVMQIGSTPYVPGNCAYFRYRPREGMRSLYAEARVVVCHAGTGSILAALEHGKPLVLVPRLKRHGEVLDDHQLELARQMEAQGATVVYDTRNLESALSTVGRPPAQLSPGGKLVTRLKEYIDTIGQ